MIITLGVDTQIGVAETVINAATEGSDCASVADVGLSLRDATESLNYGLISSLS